MHYFALFIAKCLIAREKVGALSALDFAIAGRALYGNNTFSLGVIIAVVCILTGPRAKFMVVFMLLA